MSIISSVGRYRDLAEGIYLHRGSMPEEEIPELGSKAKFVKDTYFESEVLDKSWVKESNSYASKPAKRAQGTLIFDDYDERVILLMGSHCNPEDLMMEDELLSEESDENLFDGENTTRSMVHGDILNVHTSTNKLSGREEHKEQNNLFQGAEKEVEVANHVAMISSLIAESKSREHNNIGCAHYNEHQDHENEDMISFGHEVQQSINIIQDYPETLPYSGSISLRSTSSTASTQSFAFPVLAQEWNSSPIKMPKPDKRQLRKPNHRRMKMCWVCCKF